MEKGLNDWKSLFYSQQTQAILHDTSTHILLLFLVALVVVHVLSLLKFQAKPSTKLPPGTNGWPLLGETIEFVAQERKFFRRRRTKYGPLFRTNLLGKPFVIVSGSTHIKQFARYGSESIDTITSPAFAMVLDRGSYLSHDEAHVKAKRATRKAISSESLTRFTDTARSIIREHLEDWCNQDQVIASAVTKRLQAHLASCFLMGLDREDVNKAFFDTSEILDQTLFSLPINLPGFTVHEALKKKKKMIEFIKEIYHTSTADSVMSRLMEQDDDDEETMDEEKLDEVAYRMLEMLWAGVSTSSSVMCTILHELCKQRGILKRLQEELMSTEDNRKNVIGSGEPRVNVFESVVKEGLRFMPPVTGVFRKTKVPIELGGYTIPANWGVLVSIMDTHETSSTFDNVNEFDITNWEKNSNPPKNEFIPFSPHRNLCPGHEFVLKIMSLFVKELVNMCEWRMVNSGSVEYVSKPFPFPKDGLPLRFFKRGSADNN